MMNRIDSLLAGIKEAEQLVESFKRHKLSNVESIRELLDKLELKLDEIEKDIGEMKNAQQS